MEKKDKEFYHTLNRYRSLEQRELELKKEITNVQEKKSELKIRARDKGLQYYNIYRRHDLLSRAEKGGYSKFAINKLSVFLDEKHWNQDEVTEDILFEFCSIDKWVTNNIPSKSIFKKISTTISKISDMDIGENNNDN